MVQTMDSRFPTCTDGDKIAAADPCRTGQRR